MDAKKEVAPFSLQLSKYEWTRDEYLLVDWYNALVSSGEHYQTFSPELRYLSEFLNFFKPPRILVYSADKGGIFYAFWLEPAMSGAYFGVWIRKDKRTRPSSLELLKRSFNASFEGCTVLIAVTKQEDLDSTLRRLGCKHACRIPALWDGDAADVYYLTKDIWEQRYGSGSDRQEQQQRDG